MKRNKLLIIACVALMSGILTACVGNKSGNDQQSDEQTTEQVSSSAEQPAPEPVKAEPVKKWYEQNFTLTMKRYVMTASMTQTFARKDNIISVKGESGITNLFVCTDSTRIGYMVKDNGKCVKVSEKTGFSSADEAAYKYLKSQLGETVMGKAFKKGDEGCTSKDTTILGRPAYVITKVAEEKNVVATSKGKTIMHIDNENGMIYYKYVYVETNGTVITDGVAFEVTDFSDDPTYEGLIVSLDGFEDMTPLLPSSN